MKFSLTSLWFVARTAAQIVNICVQIYNEITFSATHKIRQINNCLTSNEGREHAYAVLCGAPCKRASKQHLEARASAIVIMNAMISRPQGEQMLSTHTAPTHTHTYIHTTSLLEDLEQISFGHCAYDPRDAQKKKRKPQEN